MWSSGFRAGIGAEGFSDDSSKASVISTKLSAADARQAAVLLIPSSRWRFEPEDRYDLLNAVARTTCMSRVLGLGFRV